jgi:galactitol-specific phosphotransferase system IIC component
MNYTNLTLLLLGIAGIITHILVDINNINHNPNTTTTILKYFKTEWASMVLSLILVGVAIFLKTEIIELENAGKWIGIGIFGLGYMANSILTSFTNKAQKFIDSEINH